MALVAWLTKIMDLDWLNVSLEFIENVCSSLYIFCVMVVIRLLEKINGNDIFGMKNRAMNSAKTFDWCWNF